MPLRNVNYKHRTRNLTPEDYQEMFESFEKATDIKEKLKTDKTFDRLLTEFGQWGRGQQKGKIESMLKKRGIPRYNLSRTKQTTLHYKTGKTRIQYRNTISGRFTKKD